MSNDLNRAVVIGTIIRFEPINSQDGTFRFLNVTLGAYEEVPGENGPRQRHIYQNVQVRGKDGKDFAGKVGDPYVAIGKVRHTSWKEKDRDGEEKRGPDGKPIYRDRTDVSVVQFRPLHGIPESRFKTDAKGNRMLLGGCAYVDLEARIAKDPGVQGGPRYAVAGGTTVWDAKVGSSEEWKEGEQDREHTNWLRVKGWGDQAEEMNNLNPPKSTTLVGRYRIENEKAYEDRNGHKVYPVALVFDTMPLILGRRDERPSAASVPAKGAYVGAAANYEDAMGQFDFAGLDEDPFAPTEAEAPF